VVTTSVARSAKHKLKAKTHKNKGDNSAVNVNNNGSQSVSNDTAVKSGENKTEQTNKIDGVTTASNIQTNVVTTTVVSRCAKNKLK